MAHAKSQNHSPSEEDSEERGSCMKHSAKLLLVEAGAGREQRGRKVSRARAGSSRYPKGRTG